MQVTLSSTSLDGNQYVLGEFQDLTAYKARWQRLQLLYRVLRHNLRNEMTVIQGYADELQKAVEDVVLEFRQVPETGPPEAIFELPDTRYPEFEFVDFSNPDRFVEGRQSFEVTVKNVADVAGNFHGLIQYNEDGGEELFNPPRGYGLRKPIAAGGEETITIKYDHEPGTRYRLLPFNVQAEV